jgi:hypothetical protein
MQDGQDLARSGLGAVVAEEAAQAIEPLRVRETVSPVGRGERNDAVGKVRQVPEPGAREAKSQSMTPTAVAWSKTRLYGAKSL